MGRSALSSAAASRGGQASSCCDSASACLDLVHALPGKLDLLKAVIRQDLSPPQHLVSAFVSLGEALHRKGDRDREVAGRGALFADAQASNSEYLADGC